MDSLSASVAALPPAEVAAEPSVDIGFLAEVLLDRELPLDPGVDLTVVDLTEPAPTIKQRGWGLRDHTVIGRLVTPDLVLAARGAYRRIADGQPLPRSAGTVYRTVSGFVDDYVHRHIVDHGSEREARHRLAYFLNLPDDDFLACFRFNGDITGEYLAQVARCERARSAAADGHGPTPEPSPTVRRRRKARALRNL